MQWMLELGSADDDAGIDKFEAPDSSLPSLGGVGRAWTAELNDVGFEAWPIRNGWSGVDEKSVD